MNATSTPGSEINPRALLNIGPTNPSANQLPPVTVDDLPNVNPLGTNPNGNQPALSVPATGNT